MLIKPGAIAYAYFAVSIGGANESVDTYNADVRRNGVITTVATTITNTTTGVYLVSATLPGDWNPDDQVHVGFNITHLGKTLTCVKSIGVISALSLDMTQEVMVERLLDLLESDEVYDDDTGKATKYLRGTNTVLLEKDVTGSALSDSVSLSE